MRGPRRPGAGLRGGGGSHAPRDGPGRAADRAGRALAAVARPRIPAAGRIPYDSGRRPVSLRGATWQGEESVAVRNFPDLPFTFKTQAHLRCRPGRVAWAMWTCADDPKDGAQTPYLGLEIQIRSCPAAYCSAETTGAIAREIPQARADWKRYDTSTLYAKGRLTGLHMEARPEVRDIYQLSLLRVFSGFGRTYVMLVRGATVTGQEREVQMVVNDIFTQTGGRSSP